MIIRKVLICSCACLLFIATQGQNYFQTNFSGSLRKSFGDECDVMRNGDILVASVGTIPGGVIDITWLTRSGTVYRSAEIDLYGNPKVKQLNDNNIVVAGARSNNVYVHMLDSMGVEVWSQLMTPHPTQQSLRFIEILSDSLFLVGGVSVISGIRYLSCLDLNGNEIWSRTNGYAGTASAHSTGYFYVTGYQNGVEYIQKMTFAGDTIWGEYSSSIVLGAVSSSCLTNRGVTLLSFDGIVSEYDSNGTLLAQFQVGVAEDEFYDIANAPDGGYLVSGLMTHPHDSANFYQKIEPSGANGWRIEYHHHSREARDYIGSIDTFSGGDGYILVGTSFGIYGNPPRQPEVLVVHVDNNGCLDYDSIEITSDTTTLFSITDSILLTAEPGFGSYAWSTGDTTSTNQLWVHQPGHYWVRLGDSHCSFSDTLTISNEYCEAPDSLRVVSLSHRFALLGWDLSESSDGVILRGNALGTQGFAQFSINGTGVNQFQANSLSANTSYWWQIKQICSASGDTSAWSDIDTFTTACLSPDNLNAFVSTTSALVQWGAVANASSYTLRGKTIAAQQWLQVQISGGDTLFQANNLTPNTSYVWRVKANCAVLPPTGSNWSAIDTFTTLPLRLSGLNNDQWVDEEVTVYPNPITSSTFKLKLANCQQIRMVRLIDLYGNTTPLKHQSTGTPGAFSCRLPEHIFPSGLYLIQTICDSGVEQVSFQKVFISH